jgi:hypothetical protein
MTASASRPVAHAGRFGRLWWLPADGHGNGLDDESWAPVLEVSRQVVPTLLGVLRQAGVPAYVAPAGSARTRPREVKGRPESYQLWVGASAYGRAERALITVMPYLAREAARHGDRAWR